MKDQAKTKAQLSSELKQMRQFLQNLPHRFFMKDPDSVYLFCNQNYAQDLNIEPDSIAGKSDYDFYPKKLADKYRADDQKIVRSARPETIEEIYVHNGREFIVNTYKMPMQDEKGNVTGILGFFHDVTDFKRAEAQAVKNNAVLDAINQVFRQALICETEEDLAKKFLEVAEALTGSAFGFFGEINHRGLFDTIAISNPGMDACKLKTPEALNAIINMPIEGLDRSTMKEGKSRIVNDPANHPESRGTPKGHPPITCFLGVPLKRGDKTIGMIALANKTGGYTVEDQESIEALSNAMVEALYRKRTEVKIAQQAQEIMELSTPVIQVWDGVVVAPLIGMLDSQRTQGFMERFLDSIVETKSPVALVDITGVPTIDTQTGQHIIEAITAARLLGTSVILTGVRPAIAQTLVHLGIDLSEIETRASMSSGLRLALDMLNLQVTVK